MSGQRRRRVLQSTESTHGTTLLGMRKTDDTGADAGRTDAIFLFDHRAWRPTAWANTGRGMIPRVAESILKPVSRVRKSTFVRILVPVKTLLLGAVLTAAGLQTGDPLAARSKGRADAPVTVYQMADFQCPACRMFTITVVPTIQRALALTVTVRWAFLNLPSTTIHPNAPAA